MTEAARSPRGRAGAAVFWASIVLFAALFGLLTYRFSAGQDPSQASVPAPRPVVVRKVIKRRVVTTVVPGPGAETVTSGPATSTSLAAAETSEPVTTSAS